MSDRPKKLIQIKEIVPLNNVEPNNYNPNVMDSRAFEWLKKRIKKRGFIGRIVCRKNPDKKDKYIIIDGEHRWRAAKAIGYTEIPVIITDEKRTEAMFDTINYNKLRGEFDTLKLARVIADINKTYSLEDIEDQLGYTPEEVLGLIKLNELDFESFYEDAGKEKIEEQNMVLFEVDLNYDQALIVHNAMDKAGEEDNSLNIAKIVKEYLNE